LRLAALIRDPQPAEIALAQPTVDVGVLPRVQHGLLGRAVEAAARAAIAAGGLQDPAVLAPAGDGVLGAWH